MRRPSLIAGCVLLIVAALFVWADIKSDMSYVDPANYVYNDGGVPPAGSDWEVVPGTFRDNPITGFNAAVYRNSETGEMVLTFRGTTPTDPRDWDDNVQNAVSGMGVQYAEALAYATEMQAEHDITTVVGHSLGGGLAQYVAAMQDLRGVTFNAADVGRLAGMRTDLDWLYDAITGGDHENITNYSHSNDPLNAYINRVTRPTLGTRQLGTSVVLEGPETGLDAHGLDPLRDAMGRQSNTDAGGTGGAPPGAGLPLPDDDKGVDEDGKAPGDGKDGDKSTPPKLGGFGT